MTKEEIIKLLRGYKGEIIERENEIIFQEFNTFDALTNVYNPKTQIYELRPSKRSRLCTLEFNLERNSFDGNIQNSSGFANYDTTEENIAKIFEQYKFQKREMVQMNLFDDFN